MIILPATSCLWLIPVAVAATFINIPGMTNSVVALPGEYDHIDWCNAGWALLAPLPATLTARKLPLPLPPMARRGVVFVGLSAKLACPTALHLAA